MDSNMAKENTLLKAKGGMKESGSLVYNQETENTTKVLTQLKASGKKVSF